MAESVPETVAGNGRLRRVAAGLVLLEAAAVVVYSGVLLFGTIFGEATERDAAAFLVVLFLALGVALGVCARGVLGARRWARAPVFLWQILQVAISPLQGAERWYVAAPMVLVAVVTGVLVLRSDVIPSDR